MNSNFLGSWFRSAQCFLSGKTPLTLIALALLLYLPTIGWGIPQANAPDRTKTYATDSILPLEALAEMHNTFVVSKPDRNYGYPWWHYVVVAAAQAPYLVFLEATGRLAAPSSIFPFGLADPVAALRALTLIGRLVSILMAIGTLLATYGFVRTLLGHETGLLAALFGLASFPMMYYSGVGNLDMPVTFWSAIGVAIFASILEHGLDRTRGIWLGAMAGLAMATKDQAVLTFLPLGIALLSRKISGAADPRTHWRAVTVSLGASIAAYLFGTGMWIDPQRQLIHLDSLLFHPERLSIAAAYVSPHLHTWPGVMALLQEAWMRAVDAYSAPILIAAGIGMGLLVHRQLRWLMLFLPLPCLILLLFLPTGTVLLRYYLPFGLLVDAAAAHAVWSLRGTRLRSTAIPLAAFLLLFRLAPGVDLSWAQLHETRSFAGRWLAANTEPGDRLEHFGPPQKLPPMPAGVVTRPILGTRHLRQAGDRADRVFRYLQREGPEFIAVIPDWTSSPGMDRSRDCPQEVLRALLDGSIGYRPVADFREPVLFRGLLKRPPLDSKQVAPRVRIFARRDVVSRTPPHGGSSDG